VWKRERRYRVPGNRRDDNIATRALNVVCQKVAYRVSYAVWADHLRDCTVDCRVIPARAASSAWVINRPFRRI
jgi:hypothetical protein